jgi:hypothetical protein
MSDPINDFMALPKDQQLTTLQKLPPERQEWILGQIKQRRSKPVASVSATPSPFSLPGIKNKVLTARDWAVDQLPAVGGGLVGGILGGGTARDWALDQLPAAGGLVGGILGGGTGIETGPGALGTAALGAAAGGGLGEDLRQVLTEKFHPENKRMGPIESGASMARQAGLQAANEVGGRVPGRIVSRFLRPVADMLPALQKYPILKGIFAVGEGRGAQAAEHLTAAAANKQGAGVALEAISNTIDDISKELEKLPANQRNVQGFLDAVNARKTDMNAESGASMMPIAGVITVPDGIARNIKNLARSYMGKTAEGRAQSNYLMKRAQEFEGKEWTFGELDQLRTDLSSQLAKHRVKGSVAKYTAEKGDMDLAVDNAILQGLRDTIYPEMDRAAGKPAGYFESLKGRQSSLITLQEILEKRIRDLTGSQAVSEVTSRFGSENISLSAHAGSLPRAGIYGIREAFSPTRELETASKHVAKAVPPVYSQPWEILFTTAARVEESKPPKKRVAAALSQ